MRKMFSHILIQNVFFSVLSSNIMSSWFHLVRLLCFGFLDFMWSALDCILQVCCWCCYRRLILKLQQRDRMGKKRRQWREKRLFHFRSYGEFVLSLSFVQLNSVLPLALLSCCNFKYIYVASLVWLQSSSFSFHSSVLLWFSSLWCAHSPTRLWSGFLIC